MLTHDKKWNNEKGMVLVTAMFLTMALVVIGSFTVVMTNTELDIAKNDRFGKEAFFVADSGTPISTTLLKEIIANEEVPYYSGVTFNSNFLNEVRNYYDPETEEDLNDKLVDTTENDPDIETILLDSELAIDVDWRHRKAGSGGSLLFAMGYEGIGVDRSHGGVKTYYNIAARGKVLDTVVAEIGSVYIVH